MVGVIMFVSLVEVFIGGGIFLRVVFLMKKINIISLTVLF